MNVADVESRLLKKLIDAISREMGVLKPLLSMKTPFFDVIHTN